MSYSKSLPVGSTWGKAIWISLFWTKPWSLELILCGWESAGRSGELQLALACCALWKSHRRVETRLSPVVGTCKWPAHSRGVSSLPGAPTGACRTVLGELFRCPLSVRYLVFQAGQMTTVSDCPSTVGYLPSPRIYLDSRKGFICFTHMHTHPTLKTKVAERPRGRITEKWRQSVQKPEYAIGLGPENCPGVADLRCLWYLFWSSFVNTHWVFYL